jgi:hypothetical protein
MAGEHAKLVRQQLQTVCQIIQCAPAEDLAEVRKMLVELAKTTVDMELRVRLYSPEGHVIKLEPYG